MRTRQTPRVAPDLVKGLMKAKFIDEWAGIYSRGNQSIREALFQHGVSYLKTGPEFFSDVETSVRDLAHHLWALPNVKEMNQAQMLKAAAKYLAKRRSDDTERAKFAQQLFMAEAVTPATKRKYQS